MIHHVAITSNSPESLAAFYEKLPGLVKIKENRENGEIRSVWFGFSDGNSIVMIERGTNQAPFALVFDIISAIPSGTDKDAVADLMKNIFLLIESKTEYSFYFRDPDGNKLGYSAFPEKLSEYLPDSF